MKVIRLGRSALVLAALCLFTLPCLAEGNINFLLGGRHLQSLDSGDFDLKNQPQVGIQMSFGGAKWPVMIAADVLVSGKSDSESVAGYYYSYKLKLTMAVVELDPGIRRFWKAADGAVRPYIGGGLAVVVAGAELKPSGAGSSNSESDGFAAFGLWGNAGCMFRLGSHFNLGLDARYTWADEHDLDFDNFGVIRDVNAGGAQYGLLLGFGW